MAKHQRRGPTGNVQRGLYFLKKNNVARQGKKYTQGRMSFSSGQFLYFSKLQYNMAGSTNRCMERGPVRARRGGGRRGSWATITQLLHICLNLVFGFKWNQTLCPYLHKSVICVALLRQVSFRLPKGRLPKGGGRAHQIQTRLILLALLL